MAIDETKRDYKISVALYINGRDLDPDIVTKELRTEPSCSFRRGEEFVAGPAGRTYKRKLGVWSVESQSDAQTLSDHIEDLNSKIKFSNKSLNRIAGIEDAYVDIFMAAAADSDGEGTGEFELSNEHIAFLKKLGLPVRFTIAIVNM